MYAYNTKSFYIISLQYKGVMWFLQITMPVRPFLILFDSYRVNMSNNFHIIYHILIYSCVGSNPDQEKILESKLLATSRSRFYYFILFFSLNIYISS